MLSENIPKCHGLFFPIHFETKKANANGADPDLIGVCTVCYFESKKEIFGKCTVVNVLTLLFLFTNKLLVISTGITKCLSEQQTGKILIRLL